MSIAKKTLRITALLLVALMLGSCMSISERHVEAPYAITLEQDDMPLAGEGRVLRPALYFMQKGTGKLVAELRSITVAMDEAPAKSIVRQLLYGPKDDKLEPVAPSTVTVDKVEISLGVANVYLLSPEKLSTSESFILKLSLANTLSDYFPVKYVNLFYNGLSDGFGEYPHPLQAKTTVVWTEEYDDILGNHIASVTDGEAENESVGIVLDTPLYFLDEGGEYLLPEVRQVTYSDNNYLATLISELVKGPRNSFVYQASVAKDLVLSDTEPVWEYAEDGTTLWLDFDTSPMIEVDTYKSYLALVYTLTSFFPNLDRVYFSVAGETVDLNGEGYDFSDGMTREEAMGHLAGGIDLYFRQMGESLLVKVNRMVNEDQVWSASGRLYELMKGPKYSESQTAVGVFPAGITEDDILGTSISQTTLVVNLSENFKRQCHSLTATQEMLLVFSMVNTLTGMNGVNSVQFLVEGEKTETLAGHLYFGDIFISNPGIELTDY